jgi:hypothetical protein
VGVNIWVHIESVPELVSDDLSIDAKDMQQGGTRPSHHLKVNPSLSLDHTPLVKHS